MHILGMSLRIHAPMYLYEHATEVLNKQRVVLLHITLYMVDDFINHDTTDYVRTIYIK